MKQIIIIFRFLLLYGLFFSYSHAEAIQNLKNRKIAIALVVNKDGSYTETIDREALVDNESALQRWRNLEIGFGRELNSVAFDDITIIRPNGTRRRIAGVKISGLLSETLRPERKLNLKLDDLSVGDIIKYKLEISHKPVFGDENVSIYYALSDDNLSETRLKICYPKTEKYKISFKGFKVLSERSYGRNSILELSYAANSPFDTFSDSDLAMHSVPYFEMSSFLTYKDLGRSLRSQFKYSNRDPSSLEILAREITKGKRGKLEIVDSLYSWVRDNIAYDDENMYTGLTANDVSIILRRRRGDCKDHVALLGALLDAVGIENVASLISLDNNYTLPLIPLAQTFNHVINYIPSLNLYVDSTNPFTTLGALPFSETGKFILKLAKIPEIDNSPREASDGESLTSTDITLSQAGAIHATITAQYKGGFAVAARKLSRDISKTDTAALLKSALLQAGFSYPEGAFEFVDSQQKGLLTTHISYSAVGAIKNPGGGLTVDSQFGGEFSIRNFAKELTESVQRKRFLCGVRRMEERFMINMPEGVSIVSLPKNVSYEYASIKYNAKYKKLENKISISRILENDTPRLTCSNNKAFDSKRLMNYVQADIRNILQYRFEANR